MTSLSKKFLLKFEIFVLIFPISFRLLFTSFSLITTCNLFVLYSLLNSTKFILSKEIFSSILLLSTRSLRSFFSCSTLRWISSISFIFFIFMSFISCSFRISSAFLFFGGAAASRLASFTAFFAATASFTAFFAATASSAVFFAAAASSSSSPRRRSSSSLCKRSSSSLRKRSSSSSAALRVASSAALRLASSAALRLASAAFFLFISSQLAAASASLFLILSSYVVSFSSFPPPLLLFVFTPRIKTAPAALRLASSSLAAAASSSFSCFIFAGCALLSASALSFCCRWRSCLSLKSRHSSPGQRSL